MPVNKSMMKNMKEQYGKKKGEEVYYAVETKQKKALPKRGQRTATNKAKKMKEKTSSPMVYYTSNDDKISDKIDKNNNGSDKGNPICHLIIAVGFIT